MHSWEQRASNARHLNRMPENIISTDVQFRVTTSFKHFASWIATCHQSIQYPGSMILGKKSTSSRGGRSSCLERSFVTIPKRAGTSSEFSDECYTLPLTTCQSEWLNPCILVPPTLPLVKRSAMRLYEDWRGRYQRTSSRLFEMLVYRYVFACGSTDHI